LNSLLHYYGKVINREWKPNKVFSISYAPLEMQTRTRKS